LTTAYLPLQLACVERFNPLGIITLLYLGHLTSNIFQISRKHLVLLLFGVQVSVRLVEALTISSGRSFQSFTILIEKKVTAWQASSVYFKNF